MKIPKSSQTGFTLVELAIVFVIIGLIIGGILAARSMVETTKVNKLIQTMSQYDVAAQNFVTTYNALPGDSKTLPCPGDGDGTIGVYGSAERLNFFFSTEQNRISAANQLSMSSSRWQLI